MSTRRKADREGDRWADRERAGRRRTMKARHASCCGYCGGPIEVNNPIAELEPGVWVHRYHVTDPIRAGLAVSGTN